MALLLRRTAGITCAQRPLGPITCAQRALATMAPITWGGEKKIPGLIHGSATAPAVIVVQEWWGVTDIVKEFALKIADSGYRVLVPDIYKGKIGVDREEASHMMSTLDFANAVTEISLAAEHLKATGSPKVGITGFCMGGALTMGALAASKDLTCGAPFYGVNCESAKPTSARTSRARSASAASLSTALNASCAARVLRAVGLFEPEQLANKPVQAHFGALDPLAGFADLPTARKLEEVLKASGHPSSAVHIYEGAAHAFMNPEPSPYSKWEERPECTPYDPDRAELAWGRLLEFFGTHLK